MLVHVFAAPFVSSLQWLLKGEHERCILLCHVQACADCVLLQ